jgi:hypothetical protein
MGSADSLSLWREKLKEIIGVQGSNTDTSVSPRPLVLPTMAHAGQPSLPLSSGPQRQSTLPDPPRRQSTRPPLPQTGQQFLPSVPNRHHSLPAFKHGSGPDLLTLSMPRPLATSASPPHPQTPSSHSYSTPSPASSQNRLFGFEPSVADVRSPGDHRVRSKHLSMMSLSSSPREMQGPEWSPTTRPRGKLSKPLPAHYI